MSLGQHFFSGALSGLTSVLCLQPLDLLKTRLQQSDGKLPINASRSPLAVALEVIRKDGPLGLWRGTTPTLIRNVPGIAMYLSSLQEIRAALFNFAYFRKDASATASSTLPKLTNQGNLLAGATARMAVGTILNPISVVKARYESDIHSFTSLTQAFKSVVSGGPRELLRGAGASALRDGPYAGLFLFCYENVKSFLDSYGSSHSFLIPPSAIHLSAGAVGGAFATLTTHPFDVLKTKIQVRTEKRYQTVQSAALEVWRQRGLLGFLDGASMRLTRKVLSSAIGFAVYEGILLFMHNHKRTNAIG